MKIRVLITVVLVVTATTASAVEGQSPCIGLSLYVREAGGTTDPFSDSSKALLHVLRGDAVSVVVQLDGDDTNCGCAAAPRLIREHGHVFLLRWPTDYEEWRTRERPFASRIAELSDLSVARAAFVGAVNEQSCTVTYEFTTEGLIAGTYVVFAAVPLQSLASVTQTEPDRGAAISTGPLIEILDPAARPEYFLYQRIVRDLESSDFERARADWAALDAICPGSAIVAGIHGDIAAASGDEAAPVSYQRALALLDSDTPSSCDTAARGQVGRQDVSLRAFWAERAYRPPPQTK